VDTPPPTEGSRADELATAADAAAGAGLLGGANTINPNGFTVNLLEVI
jgi:hypothetical protein